MHTGYNLKYGKLPHMKMNFTIFDSFLKFLLMWVRYLHGNISLVLFIFREKKQVVSDTDEAKTSPREKYYWSSKFLNDFLCVNENQNVDRSQI